MPSKTTKTATTKTGSAKTAAKAVTAKAGPAKAKPSASKPRAAKAGAGKAKAATIQAQPGKTAKSSPKKPGSKKPALKKPSGLDLAAKVLAESDQPLSAKEIAERVIAAGWITTGKTPHATLYSAMLREIKAKGQASRFVIAEPGKFAVRAV